MSDRTARARAEAERRYRSRPLTGRRIARDAFIYGADWAFEWADDNPQPTTITQDDLEAFKAAWETADSLGLAGGRVKFALRHIGIEVEDER